MTKIHAPNPRYNGSVGGVSFEKGVAEATEKEHPAAFAYFRRHGFGIGEPVEEPEPAVRADARDVARTGPHRFGSRLRDAAVDPKEDDFLPPTNAGEADPHGPLVVAPEVHASGPKGIRGGDVHVDDPNAQAAAEAGVAKAVLVDRQPHPAVEAEADDDRPARNAKQEEWAAYAVSRGMDPDEAEVATRAELIERYGD